MTQEEYIKTHPEQFKDDIDKWLFLEFGIIGGCCSAEKSHEYHIARMVAEKLAGAFIDKVSEWLCNNYDKYIRVIGSSIYPAYSDLCRDFQNYMKGE